MATPTGVAPGILGIRDAGWGKGVLLSLCVGVITGLGCVVDRIVVKLLVEC